MVDVRSVVRRGAALGAALCVLGAVAVCPVAAASEPRCHVVDLDAGASFKALQAAVNAATAGDTLRVQGTCVGSTVIAKDLAFVGKSNRGLGPATLDGGHAGRVLRIETGVTVMITGLTITNGAAAEGAGILNLGRLTLTTSRVTGNVATGSGGGIASGLRDLPLPRPTIALIDSLVADNVAGSDGGGIDNSSGELTTQHTTIEGNSAQRGGGLATGYDGGQATLNSGTIVRNNRASDAGGVLVDHFGHMWLYGDSEIRGNTAVDGGGASCPDCGILSLNDQSSIHDNVATRYGGGVTLGGPGIYLELHDQSTVHDNTAAMGGGIWLSPISGACFVSTAIYDNVPDDCAGGFGE